MPKKRKTKRALPRLTMLAYSAQDLARFVLAAEQMVAAAGDLIMLARQLRDREDAREARQQRRTGARKAKGDDEAGSR